MVYSELRYTTRLAMASNQTKTCVPYYVVITVVVVGGAHRPRLGLCRGNGPGLSRPSDAAVSCVPAVRYECTTSIHILRSPRRRGRACHTAVWTSPRCS